jgi:uncharacterized membrane protein YccC
MHGSPSLLERMGVGLVGTLLVLFVVEIVVAAIEPPLWRGVVWMAAIIFLLCAWYQVFNPKKGERDR